MRFSGEVGCARVGPVRLNGVVLYLVLYGTSATLVVAAAPAAAAIIIICRSAANQPAMPKTKTKTPYARFTAQQTRD